MVGKYERIILRNVMIRGILVCCAVFVGMQKDELTVQLSKGPHTKDRLPMDVLKKANSDQDQKLATVESHLPESDSATIKKELFASMSQSLIFCFLLRRSRHLTENYRLNQFARPNQFRSYVTNHDQEA